MLNPEAEEEWRGLSADQIRTYVRKNVLRRGLFAIKEIPNGWIDYRHDHAILCAVYQAAEIVSFELTAQRFKHSNDISVFVKKFLSKINKKEKAYLRSMRMAAYTLNRDRRAEIVGVDAKEYLLIKRSVTNKFSIFRKKMIAKEND
ncbi:hypothetical protein [Exiguobacterium sp. s144]|uniref:hypothetical protein n=1 Tax=Exiguobacterium sp. s144 TaxID=2751195 RepID=UPI001BE64BFC|nr:hypothetical protein [Exiguobacterium sp. s144]